MGQRIITSKETLELKGDGILHCKVHPDAYLTEEDALEVIDAIKTLASEKPLPVILDLKGSKGASTSARHLFTSPELAKYQSAVAITVDKNISYILASFFMGINKPPYPIKIFLKRTRPLIGYKHICDDYRLTPGQEDYSSSLIELICSIAQFKFDKYKFSPESTYASDPVYQGLTMLAEEIEFLQKENQQLKDKKFKTGKYSYTVAHDLKSPMMACASIIDLLKHSPETESSPERKQLIELLENNNNRSVSMIQDIEYSKAANISFELKEIALNNIMEEIKNVYAHNKHVTVNCPENLPTVRHNEIALKQIFNNIIGNAVKHNDKDVCEVTITYHDDASFHYLSIMDNGPGIAENKREKIFDLFESSVGGGSSNDGIGLAIVKQLVNRRKGNVWVDPSFENGAKFTFSIPR